MGVVMLSSADIKRQIIQSARTNIRRQPKELPEGITEGDILEIGKALEAMTKMAGWAAVEEYMLKRSNLIDLATQENPSPLVRGTAKGYIELMQWIENTISQKNKILDRERLKHEAKNVQEDKSVQGE